MSESRLRMAGDRSLWDEGLRSWLGEYVKAYPHHTLEVLSRSQYIGVPREILEEYLEGVYFLPKKSGGKGRSRKKSNVEEAILRFRESIEGTSRHDYANNFIETRTWVQVQNACRTAIKGNAIVVIYGKPGIGKTRCLLEFTKRNLVTAPIVLLCSRNITSLYFIQKLARRLDLPETATTARLEDRVAEKLNRYPRPLLIDQANYLSELSLGTVCYLWEVARVPIVLAGTKSLYDSFMNSQLTEDVRAQLSSRVSLHYPLSGLLVPEAKAIIKRALGSHATDEAVAQIYNITGGIKRYVDFIINRLLELMTINSKELASGEVAFGDLISKAGSRLMIG
jgi:DNA transposition AAA+ family ATPase